MEEKLPGPEFTSIENSLFKRSISPLYLPLLILISLILILSSKEDSGYFKKKFSVYVIGFLMIILSESSLGYVNNDMFRNFSLLVLPLILNLLFYSFFAYKLKSNKY